MTTDQLITALVADASRPCEPCWNVEMLRQGRTVPCAAAATTSYLYEHGEKKHVSFAIWASRFLSAVLTTAPMAATVVGAFWNL